METKGVPARASDPAGASNADGAPLNRALLSEAPQGRCHTVARTGIPEYASVPQ
jgi:hypothetical protein